MLYSRLQMAGEWGMDLVLPCRYSPGPLANDPANFYQHRWWSVLDGTFISIVTNENFLSNNSDFSLTIFNLSPVLAMYDYQCGITFNNKAAAQPYLLRSSTTTPYSGSIDVIISEKNSGYIYNNYSFTITIFHSLQCSYISHRSVSH